MEQKLLLQDLANLLAEKEGISKRQAETFVRAFFDITEDALLQDNYVKITGFGTAKLVEVSERESVNIHTGERFQIQGHSKVSFTPDTNLRDLINRPFSHFTTVTLNDETTEEDLAEVDKLMLGNEAVTEEEQAPSPKSDEASIETEETETAIEEPQQENKEVAQEERSSTLESDEASIETEETETAIKESQTEAEKNPSLPLATIVVSEEIPQQEELNEAASDVQSPPSEHLGEQVEIPKPESPIVKEIEEQEGNMVFIPLPPKTENAEGDKNEKETTTEEEPRTVVQTQEIEKEIKKEIERVSEKASTISTTADIQQTQSDNVSSTQRAIYVEPEKKNKRSKVNYWKIGFIIFAAILLLQAGYWAGYNGYFDSLFERKVGNYTSTQVETTVAKKATPEQRNRKQDLVSQQASPAIASATTEKEKTSAHDSKAQIKTEVKAEPLQVNTPKSITPKTQATKPTAPKTEATKPTPKKVDYKKAAEQYQQLPKGTMLVVGTELQYKFSAGDNIYHLAKRIYGNKDYASYIILYNDLDNPDNIPIGKTIKLPKLVEKAAVEAGTIN